MTILYKIIMSLIGMVIYVWGGNGENVCLARCAGKVDPEGWITSMETSSANAGRAIKLYRALVEKGVFPILAMDCSGFVCYVLKCLGIIKQTADYNTKGLYGLCGAHPKRGALKQGDLVFHSTDGTVSGIHHVGIYLGDNKVAESRGRDVGLVITDFDDKPVNWNSAWNMYGRLDAMEQYATEDESHPIFTRVTYPMSRGEEYKAMQIALNAAGFTDYSNETLSEDGKWGKKSKAAFEKMITFYGGNI